MACGPHDVGVPCHGREGQDPHGRGEVGVAVHCGSVASEVQQDISAFASLECGR
jgi:hypothetical protein